jgi:DMSO/TMAO reductase YedYZ molybdopterin-dependent catalytic subunit
VTTPTPPLAPAASASGPSSLSVTTPDHGIWRRFGAPALAGAIAAGVSMAVGELIAGLVSGAPSLVIAIGALIIDLQPPGAKDVVVSLFGTNDKLALNILIVIVALVIAAAVGIAASRDLGRATWAFGGFGIVALLAALREPLISPELSVVTTVVAVAAGLFSLRFLLGQLAPPVAVPASELRRPAPRRAPAMPDWDRRGFLLRGAALAGGAIVAGGAGRFLLDRRALTQPTVATTLPKPAETVAPFTPAQSLTVPGITPIVVPNNDFYRIDTALYPPEIDPSTWQLRIFGMVRNPITITWAELLERPMIQRYVTLACVSNEVGGDLIGNALWQGTPIKALLDEAQPLPGADQVVQRSVDGWTCGSPTTALTDGRDAMLAVGMNGAPLPINHGFPVRMVVPGLYGYVSACKWITEIELTRFSDFDAYWVPRGWSQLGPIKTESRIDLPRDGAKRKAGLVSVAGVAWAQHRGIAKVEVQVDGGPWAQATLAGTVSSDTWRQWSYQWQATPGKHAVRVRATDNTGETQTSTPAPPAPNGATGWHSVQVSIE